MNLRQQLAADLGSRIPGCTVGLKFGHGSLEVDDKVFAFTRPDESAALKLPESRIAELVAENSEIGPLTMGKRTMREWVVIPEIAAPPNLKLLKEAMAYVASLPKTERRKPAKKSSKTAAKKTTKKVTKPR
jgi:hypothetical protein